ncbi:tyrosine-type recombinase/integrase [Aquabacterium sp.]|uniref:tyrosine-type recombinase/integrase n=1 Tax=Aquabacterium sp. TaxID=1872578 RepID=UPI003BB15BBE
MSTLTFNSLTDALFLPAPAKGRPYREYPHLSTPEFKVRVYPPDAKGDIKRQYVMRYTSKTLDAAGEVTNKEFRPTLGLVGKPRTKGALDYDEAHAAAVATMREVRALRANPSALEESLTQSKRATVQDAWEMIELRSGKKRSATLKKEVTMYERYLKPLADRYLDELDKPFWDRFAKDLQLGRRLDPSSPLQKVQGKPLREATVQGIMTLAATLYSTAHLSERIPGKSPTWNPVRLTKKDILKKPQGRTHHIELKHLARVWRAADTLCASWARDQLYVFLLTGLRRALVAELQFSEVNFKKRCLVISPHKAGTKRRAEKLDEKSPNIELPVCETVLRILKARQEFAPDKNGPVWYSVTTPAGSDPANGPSVNRDTRSNWVHIHERALEGTRFTPHDCRRTFATVATVAKAELLGVSLLMLHSPVTVAQVMGIPDITLEYINTAKARVQMREASQAVEAYVLGLLNGSVAPPDDDPDVFPELNEAVGADSVD